MKELNIQQLVFSKFAEDSFAERIEKHASESGIAKVYRDKSAELGKIFGRGVALQLAKIAGTK